MTDISELKDGDRVRVTFDATVGSNVHGGGCLCTTHGEFMHRDYLARLGLSNSVSVEKIEPPVVTFGPGDTVRHKNDGSLWRITRDGYLRLDNATSPHIKSTSAFTSDDYERVTPTWTVAP